MLFREAGIDRRRRLGVLGTEPVLPPSNEVRIIAGVKPVEGPGSEIRTFLPGLRGVVVPAFFDAFDRFPDRLRLLVRDAGESVTLALGIELMCRFLGLRLSSMALAVAAVAAMLVY